MEFKEENDALLVPEEEAKEVKSNSQKRNTKRDLIGKIKKICLDHDIPLEESDTTLNRSTKIHLQKLLAEKTEELVKNKITDKLRENQIEQGDGMREAMGLATLHLGLTTLNRIIDRGANVILPRTGYELVGFREAFDDPSTDREVKEILLCIMRENPEMLEHISNPYIRLGLVYFGAISMSIKKYDPSRVNYASLPNAEPQDLQTVGHTDAG